MEKNQIRITNEIAIEGKEIRLEFTRSPGPGGQHVNKACTAVQLRFDLRNSPSLPPEVKGRLMQIAGDKLTGAGELLITARRHRSQYRNRREAIDRLVQLIRKAAHKPKKRKPTKPPRSAVEKRLERKGRQGEKKRQRRPVDWPKD